MSTIMITGASRGIGLEMVKQFAAAGWQVLAACRNPDKAGDLKKLQKSANGKITAHALEVTDQAGIKKLAKDLKGQSIDVLVNNAGVNGNGAGDFGKTDSDAWLKTMATNVIAPMHMAEAFADNLAKSEKKALVTVSSRMGSITENAGGYYAYRSSKAAMNCVAKGLSNDLKDRGITVVVVHPGWVRTDMGGASAPLSPEESVSGLRKVIEGLRPADNGKFINYDGTVIPW